jgi:hypothetical protein
LNSEIAHIFSPLWPFIAKVQTTAGVLSTICNCNSTQDPFFAPSNLLNSSGSGILPRPSIFLNAVSVIKELNELHARA